MIAHFVMVPQKLQKCEGALGGWETWQSYPNQTVASGGMKSIGFWGAKIPMLDVIFLLTYSVCSGLSCENLRGV